MSDKTINPQTDGARETAADADEPGRAAGTANMQEETGQQDPDPSPAEGETPRQRQELLKSQTDRTMGLDSESAKARMEAGMGNTPVEVDRVTLGSIIRRNVCTYFNLIFLIIAVFLCVAGSFRDLTFLPVIISNTLIGIVQEWRAKKLLDQLNIMTTPGTTVVRDGVENTISPSDLVKGDLVRFGPGNQIPADAIVCDGAVSVNESLLTGEADEIAKKEGDRLLSGSFVVSGSCSAILDQVGEASYISRLTLEAKARKKGEESEMIRSLDRLVKIVGILIIPISIILFVQQYVFNHAGLRVAVTSTAAAVIGMIPEGLYLLASVALAVSAMRLAINKVLVHSMKSIETLARVDVLCVDKTGTITESKMKVSRVIPLSPAPNKQIGERAGSARSDGVFGSAGTDPSEGEERDTRRDFGLREPDMAESFLENIDYAEDTDSCPVRESNDPAAMNSLELAVGDFAAAMIADNETMRAIRTHFTRQSGRKSEKVIPFSSRYKYSAAKIGGVSYVLGAPEYVLGSDFYQYEALIEQYAVRGYRVLVFGEYSGELYEGELEKPIAPRGLILLMNPVREKAPETFRYFEQQGVEIKVISGDSPVTVAEVAKKAGVAGAEKYVDARSLTSDNIDEACRKYTVFGRVTPQQKRMLVEALKRAGHTVAMTGDGVNDILAMKDADCSIAMASGADAAIQTAQIVLTESDFSKMPHVVGEGRRVVNNIERTASLFLVKNIFSILLSIFSIIFMVHYPLAPSQVSLISMFTIGIPAFFMALEISRGKIKGHFLSNVFFRALPAGLTDFAVISGLVIFCQEFRVSSRDLSTSCTILLAIVGVMILYRIMQPMTKFHWVLWFAMIFGILFCMTFLNQIFSINMVSRKCAMLLIIFAIITEPSLRYMSLLTEKLWDLGKLIKEKWIEQRDTLTG